MMEAGKGNTHMCNTYIRDGMFVCVCVCPSTLHEGGRKRRNGTQRRLPRRSLYLYVGSLSTFVRTLGLFRHLCGHQVSFDICADIRSLSFNVASLAGFST
jgi:hypothetical protein